jgi:predicted secreted protein
MATVAIPGFKATMYLATSSSGGTARKLGELKDFTLTLAGGTLDATSKDSAGWKEHLPGLKEWSGSGSAQYLMESADVGQEEAYTALTGGHPIYCWLKEASTATGGGGTQVWKGLAVVTGLDVESPLDGPAGYKVSLKGTATLAKGTIST